MHSGPSHPKTYDRGQAPRGYVAGRGRGEVGFITRSDIGPAAPAPGARRRKAASQGRTIADFGDAPQGYVAGRGRGLGSLARTQGELGGGNRASAAAAAPNPYDRDDEEADQLWEQVDAEMSKRAGGRKRPREDAAGAEDDAASLRRRQISSQLSDVRQDLKSVSAGAWAALPEAGDHVRRNRPKRRAEVFLPVTDQMLRERALGSSGGAGADAEAGGGLLAARGRVMGLKLDEQADGVSGQAAVDAQGYLRTLAGAAPERRSAAEIGDIRKAQMLLKSVTATNPSHGPGWVAAARVEEYAGRLTQARRLALEGCARCPSSEDLWLEAARLHSHRPEERRALLKRATDACPASERLWKAAAEAEGPPARRRGVLRRALEAMPGSEALWREAVELEGREDARLLLSRAVECVPHAVDLWLALAKLEDYAGARRVLEAARERLPTELAVWMAAAALEEARLRREDSNGKAREGAPGGSNGNAREGAPEDSDEKAREGAPGDSNEKAREGAPEDPPTRIVRKAVGAFEAMGEAVSRERWMAEAEAAEASGSPLTAAAIVECASLSAVGLDALLADADALAERGSRACAAALLRSAVAGAPHAQEEEVWLKLLHMEGGGGGGGAVGVEGQEGGGGGQGVGVEGREGGGGGQGVEVEGREGGARGVEGRGGAKDPTPKDPTAEGALLRRAVSACPESELLWLLCAKHRWRSEGDLAGARSTLQSALLANRESEEIWLAAAQLERENGLADRARALLAKARGRVRSPRVWLKAALLERDLAVLPAPGGEGGPAAARDRCLALCEEGVAAFPSARKLYLLAAEVSLGGAAGFAALRPGGGYPGSTPMGGTPGEGTSPQGGGAGSGAAAPRDGAAAPSPPEGGTPTPPEAARRWLRRGLRACGERDGAMWRLLALLEESASGATRARSLLDAGRARAPECVDLWVAAVRLEARCGNDAAALQVLSRGLQACPGEGGGRLWAEAVRLAPRHAKKAKVRQALAERKEDPFVVTAVAELFAEEKKAEKARKWFERAVMMDADAGDAWASFYAFEEAEGGPARQRDVMLRCEEAAPTHGEAWTSASKRPDAVAMRLPVAALLVMAAAAVRGRPPVEPAAARAEARKVLAGEAAAGGRGGGGEGGAQAES